MINESKPLFANRLQDAIAKIDIAPDLQITHSDYPPLIIAKQYQNWIQQMSPKVRDRYLTVKLQQYLYAIFNGDLKPKWDSDKTANADSLLDGDEPQAMVNCADEWYETRFYTRLTQFNHGRGYSDPGWLIHRKTENLWQVSKNALTLNIDPQQDLSPSNTKLQIGQTVTIKMPPSLIDRGVYIAVGDAGSPNSSNTRNIIVQLYFNVSSQTALLLLDSLTQQLNYLEVPFEFKTAYYQLNSARPDAAILEFMSRDWQKIQPVIKSLYLKNAADFQVETPFFCKRLHSGLGLSEKPSIPFDKQPKNIGQYYCGVAAEAIINLWKNSKNRDRLNSIDEKLKEKINLNFLYLNLNSKDVYQAF